MRSKDDLRRGIVLPDARAVARKVRIRRIKRKLKAALSLAIAAAAGTYIACDSGEKPRPNVPPNPTTDEISNLPAPRDAGTDAAADAAIDAPIDAPVDAAPKALVRRDAGPDAKVDRTEHRKGMPVPDNLLE
ncbi:MAG TPA: hypothetical protein VIV11_05695 [Kofleriaceae bacterium]